jgi:hypothetical protein
MTSPQWTEGIRFGVSAVIVSCSAEFACAPNQSAHPGFGSLCASIRFPPGARARERALRPARWRETAIYSSKCQSSPERRMPPGQAA